MERRKHKLDIEDDEDDENLTQIKVGDLVVSAKIKLQDCKTIVKDLLRDKKVSSYLNSYSWKKIIPSYVE
jgi:hypothetical protein